MEPGSETMKHMFISHSNVTEAFNNSTSEDRKKYFNMMKDTGKDYGVDLIFWGNPWGVAQSLTFVCTSDKSLDNYIEFRRAFGRKLAEASLQSYFSETNTITVTEMP
jgi:hypothetical protein